MEQQSRSKATTNATNATNHQPIDKTSKIKPVHVAGLLALNPGPPSTYSSVLSTSSVGGLGIDTIHRDTPANFFHDPKNIGFRSADGEPWYLVHNYNEKELKFYRNYSRWNLSKVIQGRDGEEIEKLMKYVTWSGKDNKLFDKGGPRLTPVMTITGLQKILKGMKRYLDANVFDVAEKNILLFIHGNAAPSAPIQQLCLQTLEKEPASGGASISTSRMQVLNMRMYDVLLHLSSSPRNRVCRFRTRPARKRPRTTRTTETRCCQNLRGKR
jgi:hypothetical protein